MLRLILKRDFREILKRIVRKVILIQCKKALPKAAGALQLSFNQDTGVKANIHDIQEAYSKEYTAALSTNVENATKSKFMTLV